MRYLPHTEDQIRQMLDVIGAASVDSLFDSVPTAARLERSLHIPPALGEPELMRHLSDLARKNVAAERLSFVGGGIYHHHIPPAVDQLLLRSEFYTAYTPYQPEVAQGTLQAIWEFQTLASELLGLPLANASMYDGASAAAEGAQMASRLTRRSKVVLSGCLHPETTRVVETYLSGQPKAAVVHAPAGADGCYDLAAIERCLDEDVAAVLVGYPGFRGTLKDLSPLTQLAHQSGALVVSNTWEPYALALFESPGEMGVDIATAEGQGLATPPNFGGPGLGLFACRDSRKYLQQVPGRLCGETVDTDGKRGFVLTLSTREQHIRRERATSNICTNQGLLALSFTIRLSLLGRVGFEETARRCLNNAHYLKRQLGSLNGYEVAGSPAAGGVHTFNEFCVTVRGGDASKLVAALREQRIESGLALGRVNPAQKAELLIASTELHSKRDLDRLLQALDDFRG